MGSRLELQRIFEDYLGSRNVYYNPPEGVKIKYPAIVYALNRIDKVHADDKPYTKRKSYSVTVISRDPDLPIIDTILDMPLSRYDRQYLADNLYHDVIDLYY